LPRVRFIVPNRPAQFFDNLGYWLASLANAKRRIGRSVMISGNHRGRRDNPSRSRRYPGVCPAFPLPPTSPAFQFSF
jgi:hypothetical protein